MFEWLDRIIRIFQAYPEIFAGTVGILVPVGFSEVLRAVYFPKDWTTRDQWKAILPIDFILAYAITHTLWHFLDQDHDAAGLLIIGSTCFAFAALAIHMFGIRVLLRRWPWIGDPDP